MRRRARGRAEGGAGWHRSGRSIELQNEAGLQNYSPTDGDAGTPRPLAGVSTWMQASGNPLAEPVVGKGERYTAATRMLFARRNPREAFERQAVKVFPSVFGTALRLTRSREEAEDLAQEAMVRAYEAFDRFDGANFKAWMLRIVTNLYINRYRQRQRGPQLGSLTTRERSSP